MLTQIQIQDFTIIEQLDLELKSGMNVITGETGTGKSVIVDALELAMGSRADSNQIRHGSDRCNITAHFHLENNISALNWLKELELDEGEECTLRRTISREGRSKAYINSHLVPLQKLKSLASLIINVHGQHESQHLLQRNEQARFLDAYANNQSLRQAIQKTSEKITELQKNINEIEQQTQNQYAEQQLLEFQLKELDELAISENEYIDIEAEHRKLAKADTLLESLYQVDNRIAADDEHNITQQLVFCINTMNTLQHDDENLKAISELLNQALIHLQEANSEIQHYIDKFDRDPQRLSWLENRLSKMHALALKHRINAGHLYNFHQSIRQRLQHKQQNNEALQALGIELETLKGEYLDIAEELSQSRQNAVKKLAPAIESTLQQLGMPEAKFAITLNPHPNGNFPVNGLEQIDFLVSANPGQPVQALHKVASGGEISRISLAIQVITTHTQTTPCLVFDEVDVGIGGGTAEIVGTLLRKLSHHAQILCITHLPQVAAQGHHHYRVEKQSSQNKTTTQITLLYNEDKVIELARMLGGVKITEQTINHAREMLEQVC